MAGLVLILFVLPCVLVGVWFAGWLAADVVQWMRRRAAFRARLLRRRPAAVYGFPVVARPALPVRDGEDGPGRYRVGGVDRATAADVVLHVDADTLANARVKAELRGVVVTAVEKEKPAV